ncbi:hypothetical protein PC114_g9245 [Phytophthora cactorum]|nr:hypothetical protein PC114_g9245 [Phytophthora cactorum]
MTLSPTSGGSRTARSTSARLSYSPPPSYTTSALGWLSQTAGGIHTCSRLDTEATSNITAH